MPAPFDLRTDGRPAPAGIDTVRPEFAWRPAVGSGRQAGHILQVATAPGFDPASIVWDSGRVAGAAVPGVRYDGPALQSNTSYWWRVAVVAEGDAQPGAWSAPATFETGILDPAGWSARWIGGPAPGRKDPRHALYLRGVVRLPARVVRARAYVTALGWYRFLVNGTDLTGPALVPRFTPFDRLVEYQCYDVTAALQAGVNVLGLAIGDGRFRGAMGLTAKPNTYGTRLAGLVQIHADLADGSAVVISSDESWHAGPGRIVTSDPMLGETVDLRIPADAWLAPDTTPAGFVPAEYVDDAPSRLIGEEVARVTEVARIPARTVTRTKSGSQIVDLGQNFAGVVRIRLDGPAGTRVTLTHSEKLKPDGEIDVGYIHPFPFNHWAQRDTVVLDGTPTWWSPWFTIHGFRYVAVEGMAAPLTPDQVEGIVLSSDLPAAGDFDCSDARLVRLRQNVRWSLLSNFTDTPTDCPTRERSGWTGDIQAFAPAATTFVDVQAYLRRYLRILAVEQFPDGRVPIFIPAQVGGKARGSKALHFMAGAAGWGDAAVRLPWTLYRHYGDRMILERQFASMTGWVDQLAARARKSASIFRRRWQGKGAHACYVVDSGFDFGEWLRPEDPGLRSGIDGLKRGGIVATAYLENSARTVAQIATLIGRDREAAHYGALADHVRAAWRDTFLFPEGRIATDRQDDYVRALAFDLLEPQERAGAVARLVERIEAAGDHLGTGFLSTPMLLPVLVDHGRADVAWRLLLQTSAPSWLYQIERGATTVWESWKGNAKGAESQNHYAFGAVASFLTTHIAGLSPAAPGYAVIDIRPEVGDHLDHAGASVMTPYGAASSRWRRDGGRIALDIVVPAGTTARVHAGRDPVREVPAGSHSFAWDR